MSTVENRQPIARADRKLPPDVPADPPGIRVAEYVRMSTDLQQYSIENQQRAIREFAQERGMTIVRTYADAAKSGVVIDHRDALKQMIQDVEAGQADFSAILVYDVSRWGRFQDADESAYYEYICRRANVAIHYCAEQFENDGSPASAIIKGVKRAMAAEYSRELSVKVDRGQRRLTELGYRQGGSAGFGLRRMLVDGKGKFKGILEPGQHKSIQTDRVILVPGPPEEVEIVREMYRAFVEDRKSTTTIARSLNDRGIRTERGSAWNLSTVRAVLTNEKYIGNNIRNRHSSKLGNKQTRNPPAMWIRKESAFEPVISIDLFIKAQTIFQRHCGFSNEELLDGLRRLLKREGRLSVPLIEACQDLPSKALFQIRFGSMTRAYELVGFPPVGSGGYSGPETTLSLRRLRYSLIKELAARLRNEGSIVNPNARAGILTINNRFTAFLTIARWRPALDGSSNWVIRPRSKCKPDITVVARMDYENRAVKDYYLLPKSEARFWTRSLTEDDGAGLDAYRFANLDFFYRMARETQI